MTIRKLIPLTVSALALGACTTADLEAISAGLAQGMANYSYAPSYGSSYGYSPYRSSGYGNNRLWVGYNQCSHTGSHYRCDTTGDGYADMMGDASDGSLNSSSLRINGRGEAFTWNSNRGEWERNRAYDTGRSDRYHDRDHRRYRDDHD
ncbi:MAG: hypothetical protein CMK07_10915 [Ponticaulis sp.]|nr:hypothetical protein [Ponticaulis sp.]